MGKKLKEVNVIKVVVGNKLNNNLKIIGFYIYNI